MVRAIDPVSGQAEVILNHPDPLVLLGASPDGRYLLLEKEDRTNDAAVGVPCLYDRSTGELHVGQQLQITPRAVAWSGSGFWLDWLVHLDLDLKVNTYPRLRERLSLGENRRLVSASFSRDGQRVAALVVNEQLADGGSLNADLVIGMADGGELRVIEQVVQPWFGKSGYVADLALSPEGDWLILRGASPGTALISTTEPARERWKPLLGDFVGPGPHYLQPDMGPSIRWSPDGSHVWYPTTTLGDRSGQVVARLPEPFMWALWRPDSKALLLTSFEKKARLVSPEGNVQKLAVTLDSEPLAMLSDGRVLVSRTVYPD